jgi:RNA:NAD 2'-phosphotransferase (TPT1/KptA family)
MGDLNSLSHFLARLLRHEARKRGLEVTPGTYTYYIENESKNKFWPKNHLYS